MKTNSHTRNSGLALWGALLLAVPAKSQNVVAKLEFDVPTAASFVVRGAVPLPAGTVALLNELKAKDLNGAVIGDTQIEVVSYYPSAAGQTQYVDVAEVIARVNRGSLTPGTKAAMEIVLAPSGAHQNTAGSVVGLTTAVQNVPATLQSFINDPLSIVVLADDYLGNQYAAYPLDDTDPFLTPFRAVRAGPYMGTQESVQTMLPTSLSASAFPHLFLTHSYLSTQASEPVLLWDLRVSNGFDGGSEIEPIFRHRLGKVYFKSLRVLLAADASNWSLQDAFPNPFGTQANTVPTTEVLNGRTYRSYPLIKANGTGSPSDPLHMMPCKGQFHRRMVISSQADTTLAKRIMEMRGVGVVLPGLNAQGQSLYSWNNRATARYFPTKNVLPSLDFTNTSYGGHADLSSTIATWLNNLKNTLRLGTPALLPHYTPAGNGTQLSSWARPLGVATEGYTEGGHDIAFLYGHEAVSLRSVPALQLSQLEYQMASERQFTILWTPSGRPAHINRWLIPTSDQNQPTAAIGPVGPNGPALVPAFSTLNDFYNQSGANDVQFCTPSITVLANQVPANLRPGYDGPGWWESTQSGYNAATNLNGYQPYWNSHSVRYTRYAIALATLLNDQIAKGDLLGQAEMARMSYSEYRQPPSSGDYIPSHSFYPDRAAVEQCNHATVDLGRQEGWQFQLAAAAYGFGDPEFRNKNKIWFDRIAQMAANARQDTSDQSFINAATGQPYAYSHLTSRIEPLFFPNEPQIQSHQSWEQMIVVNGLRAIAQSVYSSGDPLRLGLLDIEKRTALGVVAPVHWSESGNFVWSRVPVRTKACDSELFNCDPTFLCTLGVSNPLPILPYNGDNFYVFQSLASGLATLGDPLFAQRGLATLGVSCTSSCLPILATALEASLDPTSASGSGDRAAVANRIWALGLLQ